MNFKTIELEISLEIRKALEAKTLNPFSAIAIVRKGMELLQNYQHLSGADKKKALMGVLEHVSAGNDGILGTEDDLLPEATLKSIQTILSENLFGDIVNTFADILKGNIQTDKIMTLTEKLKTVASGCFQCLKKHKKTSPVAPIFVPIVPEPSRLNTVDKKAPVSILNSLAEMEPKSDQVGTSTQTQTDLPSNNIETPPPAPQ